MWYLKNYLSKPIFHFFLGLFLIYIFMIGEILGASACVNQAVSNAQNTCLKECPKMCQEALNRENHASRHETASDRVANCSSRCASLNTPEASNDSYITKQGKKMFQTFQSQCRE